MNSSKFKSVAFAMLLALCWAISFVGFVVGYYLCYPFGIIIGICGALVLASPGLVLVLLVELYDCKQKLHEKNRPNR